MEKLARNNAAFVLDVLSGRLAFERTGVKLYDAVIDKIERKAEPRFHAIVGQLRHIREEEKEHEEWLEAQIRSLGGHPEHQSEMAKLELEEGSGIERVIVDGHEKVIHLLHALLAAELADNAGWDVLVKLAGEAGDREAKAQFALRLAQEAKHLLYIREVVLRAAEVEILGRERPMPEGMGGVAFGALRRGAGLLTALALGAGALLTAAFVGMRRPELRTRARRFLLMRRLVGTRRALQAHRLVNA
jgi:rubrerythrin